MSQKGRRRRKPKGGSTASARSRGTASARAGEEDRRPGQTGTSEEARRPEREGFLSRFLRPRQASASPFPPLGVSLGRGAQAAGGSPLVLAASFLGLLTLWGGFTLLDAALSPQGMVFVMAVPPVHVPLDVGVLQSLLRTSSSAALLTVVALGVGRGLVLGAVALLVLGAVRGAIEPGPAIRRLPRVVVSLFGIYGLEVALFLFLLLFLQPILGPAAVLVLLVLGLHLLGFAPVVAAAEGVPAGSAIRLGLRASRLPGPRHLTLVLVYFLVVLYAGAGVTAVAGASAPATPSVLTWGIALLATFVHASMLGTLAYRWDSVRERVLAEEEKRQADRRGARGRGSKRPTRTSKASPRRGGSGAVPADAEARDRSVGEGPGEGAGSGGDPGRPRRARGASKGRRSRKGKRR